jgi:uncharacterized protein with HEPN domain
VRDDRERLADVLAAIDRIRRYVQDDRTRFDTDELLQSAVLHWIEIIGEAARGVRAPACSRLTRFYGVCGGRAVLRGL